jgi:hypothetical protein
LSLILLSGSVSSPGALGWRVTQHLSHHLALLTEPGQIARELRTLIGPP